MKLIFKILIAILVIAFIAGGVLLLGNFFDWWHIDNLVGETKTYEISETVTDFEFDVSAAQVKFLPGEKLTVQSNHKYVDVKTEDGKLSIREERANLPINVKMPEITITVPSGFSFKTMNIKTLAGTIGGGGFAAGKVTINLTGGAIVFDKIKAEETFTVNSTGGKVQVTDSTLNRADMNLTAGDCEISARLTGNSNLKCGSGVLKLTLEGDRDDYAVTFKRIIGSAKYDGVSAEADKEYGSGKNTVRLEGGAGSIEVLFADK